jgi:NADPH:quinone reductase-like Zn-dependent oxidoreductase
VTLISTLAESSQIEATNPGARAARYTARPDGTQLAELARLIDQGQVDVKLTATYPFDAAPEALVRLEKRARARQDRDCRGRHVTRS